MTVVTNTYLYKPLLRKKKPVALAVPAIVTIAGKRGRKVAAPPAETDAPTSHDAEKLTAKPPANDDRKSSIVTVRRRGRRFADVPDMTPEEHRRVGDLADALWRELVRRATGKDQS